MDKAVTVERLAASLESFDRLLLDHPTPQTVLRATARLAIDYLGASVAISCELRLDGQIDGLYTSTADDDSARLLAEDLQRALPSLVHDAISRSSADVLPRFVPLPIKESAGAFRCAVVPVVVGGKAKAVLVVIIARRLRAAQLAPTPSQIVRPLVFLAARLSAGLLSVTRQANVQQQLADQASLNKVTLALASAAHGRDLLDLIVRSALHLSGAHACSLFVHGAHGLQCAARVEDTAPEHVDHDAPATSVESRVAAAVLMANAQVLTDAEGQPLPQWNSRLTAPFVVGLPVRYERQMLGALCVVGPPDQGFTAGQVALLWVLCSHTAVTLENARLIDEERRRAHQASALLDAATASGASLGLDDVLSEIVMTTARLTGADRSSILLLDATGNHLRPAALFNMDATFVQSWRQHPLRLDDELLSREAITTGLPVVVNDAEWDPRTDKDAVRLFGDRSILVVPMRTKGEVIGTLWVNHISRHYAFTDDDVRTTVAIANQAAMAIINARLYAESQRTSEELAKRRLAELSTLLGVSTEIASILHIDAVLASIVRNVRNVTQVDSCRLYRLPREGGELMLAAQASDDAEAQPVEDSPSLRRLARLCVDQRQPVALDPHDSVEDSPYRAMLAVPLIARDTQLGALCVYHRGPHRFLEDEQQLLMAFANQAAVAIEHAALFESLRRRVRELSGLHELSMTMVALPDLRHIIDHLTSKLGELLDVEHCVLLMHDRDTHTMVAQTPGYGLTDEETGRLRVHLRDGSASAHVWQSGQPYLSNDAETDPGHLKEWVQEFGETTLLLVPMRIGETTIGMIRAANKRNGPFTQDDVRLLTILATQAAAIVQHAILYDRVNRERGELDAILINTSDSIFVFDLQGLLVRMNRAAETLFGVPPSPSVTPRCAELLRCQELGPRAPCGGGCVIDRVARERTVLPYVEHKLLSDDGRILDVTSSLTYIEGRGSESGRVVMITRDMSRLKEVERLKTDFVSMVSHELRTPLAIIKGYAATLLRLNTKVDRNTELRWLHSIDESCDRLTRLIDNILNVSRIESGRFKINPQPVEVNELVRRAINAVKTQAADHTFSLSLPDPSPVITADRDQTEQVLLNLLANALKYSNKGSAIAVTIRLDDDWMECTIADDGPGIPPAQIPHLFDKFYRVDGPAGGRSPGSGLGLYICKTIIDAHQGKIWATSTPEKGSAFTFALRRMARVGSAVPVVTYNNVHTP